MKEFQMTSKVIYVLFFIEILLILFYYYLPSLIKKIDNTNGTVLLDNGAFLDKQLSLGSSEVLQVPSAALENQNSGIVYLKQFTFSMWVYLNIQPPNFSSYTKETTIFDCGNGKPSIVYYNNMDEDIHKNKYKVYFTKGSSSSNNRNRPCDNCFEIMLPNQKWNNFVFNYKSTQADLFVNGELVKVFKFTDTVPSPTFYASDSIIIGSDNGLDGAICNVRFYPTNLTSSFITTNYNLLMYKSPPVMV